ncbi:hypothetical protein GCM10022243_48300 [Saccharothrix violaceirubra]|uniref:Uncharacterized protein n=1 Tax=Saccharothrix violaceirubra TaxID=413306 RepID=A0A7W7WUV1_9PSEU|nr:hypothetical protein [Saccharothrix violaceirubra]MBB4963828.1 hypothetical protein [Saccharothrix violaceirubra]
MGTFTVPCPDCGHSFPMTTTTTRRGVDTDGHPVVNLTLDLTDAKTRFAAHVLLNPDQHPTFTIDTQPDSRETAT